MSDNVFGTFVSQKICKIRWKPEDLEDAEYFVTGSCDNDINQVCIWSYPVVEESGPVTLKSLCVPGDVTELRFIKNDTFAFSTSTGSVSVIGINILREADIELNEVQKWENLHYYNTGELSSCSSIACFDEDIATVGEDGRLVLLTLSQSKPLRRIDQADSCPLTCVCFLKHNELLSASTIGQMKIWDLRTNSDKPMSVFMTSPEPIFTTCVTHHPTQNHLLLAGAEDGTISVWDLRKSTFAVNVLNAHKESVNEILFHPTRPEHLFTCSFGGEVWHWNTSRNIKDYTGDEGSWLYSDATKHRMEIITLMSPVYKPINSIDVNRTRLVCGCDNEAIYLIKNLDV